MRRSKQIPWRSRNHSGWWIASYIERFEYYDEPKRDLNRRCLAWENTIIVKAQNREVAYKKAMAVGRRGEGSEAWNKRGRKGAWRFEGLTLLLPIYEELEDGAEVLWEEHDGRTVRKIREMVRSKSDLSVFYDKEDGEVAPSSKRTSPKVGKAVAMLKKGTCSRT